MTCRKPSGCRQKPCRCPLSPPLKQEPPRRWLFPGAAGGWHHSTRSVRWLEAVAVAPSTPDRAGQRRQPPGCPPSGQDCPACRRRCRAAAAVQAVRDRAGPASSPGSVHRARGSDWHCLRERSSEPGQRRRPVGRRRVDRLRAGRQLAGRRPGKPGSPPSAASGPSLPVRQRYDHRSASCGQPVLRSGHRRQQRRVPRSLQAPQGPGRRVSNPTTSTSRYPPGA